MCNYLTFFLAFGLLAITSFASIPLEALPAQIIIIRQAENNTTPYSEKKYKFRNETDKNKNNEELSLKGKERAAALVPYLLQSPEFITFGKPAAIYASIPPKPGSSQRSKDTMLPIADFLKIDIRDTFESNDYKGMVEEIKKDPALSGKTVLICWDYTTIPEMARAFGAFQTPATWSTSAYDRTWVITFQPSGKAIFQNLPQRLMFGDSST